MASKAEKIILDCDPGIDDAFAIFLALSARQQIELLGICTVAGNVGLDLTTENARRLVTLAGGKEARVFAGCARALLKSPTRATDIHGDNGLGGVRVQASLAPLEERHGVDFLSESIMREAPGSVTLCATGPLTNVALALVKEPLIASRLKRLVFMGGALDVPGTEGAARAAEFNIFSDPHAAEIVLSAGIADVVMMGLDVTRQVNVDEARRRAIASLGTRCGLLGAAMLESYGREKKYLHDPTVIAYLLRPELFNGERHPIAVDLKSDEYFGRTERTDDLARSEVTVIKHIDVEGFFTLLFEHLAILP
jgi:purine nucleosidase